MTLRTTSRPGGATDATRPRVAAPERDLVSRSYVIELLKRELFDEAEISGGTLLVHKDELAESIARERGYRRGWNDRARSIARQLEQGRTMAALRELRDAVPTLTEAVSVASPYHASPYHASPYHGEGG